MSLDEQLQLIVDNTGIKNHLNNESFSLDVEVNETINENEA